MVFCSFRYARFTPLFQHIGLSLPPSNIDVCDGSKRENTVLAYTILVEIVVDLSPVWWHFGRLNPGPFYATICGSNGVPTCHAGNDGLSE